MNKKTAGIISLCCLLGFIVLLIVVKTVNVKTNALGIEVGLYSINNSLLPSVSITEFGSLSDILMLISFVFFGIVGLMGISEFLKKRSLRKVNHIYYLYVCMLLLIVIIYLFFEIVTVNYRPILIDGVKEASFPSSHIFITSSLVLCSCYVFSKYIGKNYSKSLYIISIIMIIFVTFGRLLSKNHWFTDCIAGLLISFVLYFGFVFFDKVIIDYKNKEHI